MRLEEIGDPARVIVEDFGHFHSHRIVQVREMVEGITAALFTAAVFVGAASGSSPGKHAFGDCLGNFVLVFG
jgi:hypothetical protein